MVNGYSEIPVPGSRQKTPPQDMAELGRAGAKARKVKAVEWRIRDLVESAPPLTAEQRSRLTTLLGGDAA